MSVDITNSLPSIGKQIQDKISKFEEKHPDLVANPESSISETIGDIDGLPISEPDPVEASPAVEAPAQESTPVVDAPTPTTELSPAPVVDEWEDIELDDEDTGYKYNFKAKKAEAEYLRKGYLRESTAKKLQADYTKKTTSLARQREWLVPMIENGDLDKIAPLIQQASSDPVLAHAVLDLYNKRIQNQPLVYSQPGYSQPVQVQAVSHAQNQVDYAQALINDDSVDEYTKQAVLTALGPAMQELNQLKSYMAQQQQAQAEAQRQQQADAMQRQQWTQTMVNAHAQLALQYPNEFQGPSSPNAQAEVAKLADLDRIATSAGLDVNSWGYVGRFAKALEIKNARPLQAPQVASVAPSVAGQTIAQLAQQAKEIATAAAAKASHSVASGMSTGGAPPPVAPKRRAYKDSSGKPLPLTEAIRKAALNAEDRLR